MHAATSQLTRAIGRTLRCCLKIQWTQVEPRLVAFWYSRWKTDTIGPRGRSVTCQAGGGRRSQRPITCCGTPSVTTHVCHQCHVPGVTGVKRRGCRETWGWSSKRSKLQKRFQRVLNFERVLNERQLEAARAA